MDRKSLLGGLALLVGCSQEPDWQYLERTAEGVVERREKGWERANLGQMGIPGVRRYQMLEIRMNGRLYLVDDRDIFKNECLAEGAKVVVTYGEYVAYDGEHVRSKGIEIKDVSLRTDRP